MSMAHLGPSFDIHTGGVDLIFPHHEDEIAQSEAATGQPFVGTWLHCAHLQIGGTKMAKSTGNIARRRRAARRRASRRARCATRCIAVHYRAGLNHSDESLAAAAAARSTGSTRSSRPRRVPRGQRGRRRRSPTLLATARDGVRGGARRRPQRLGGARRRCSTSSAS